MSSSHNFKTIPFTIKLKYNVGESTEFQYIDIDKFSYQKIKNSEMIEKQKENYINSKEKEYNSMLNSFYENYKGTLGKDDSTLKNDFDNSPEGKEAIKQKQWIPDDEHYAKLKDFIYHKTNNEKPFKIVYCPYFYEYDSLVYHIDSKSDLNENVDINSLEYCNREMEILKDNKILKDRINSWIKILKNKKEDLIHEDTLLRNLFYLKQEEEPELKIAIDNRFADLGLLYKDGDDSDLERETQLKIKRNKLAYLLFETNLQKRIEEYLYGTDVIDFSNPIIALLFNLDSYGNKNIEKTFEDTKQIYNFETIDKIHRIIKNIMYLKKNKFIKVKKLHDKGKKDHILFNNIFNLPLLENKVISASKKIIGNFEKEIKTYKDIKGYYTNNIKDFFIENKNDNNDTHITEYFTFLKNNYIQNITQDSLPFSSRFQKVTQTWNTDKKRKNIVKDYAKYLLEDDDIASSDDEKNIDELYNRLKVDKTKLTNIITYYNLHKILETLYLSKGTILKVPLFEIFNNKLQEPKENAETYIKILQINPMKLNFEQKIKAFDNNKLQAIFEIKFEKLYTFSKINFYLNIIDIKNPDTLLRNLLKNQQKMFDNDIKKTKNELRVIIEKPKQNEEAIQKQQEQLEKELEKKEKEVAKIDIITLNNTYGIYNIYPNKIFPNAESNNKIFIEPKFNYDKLSSNFNILKKNIEIINENKNNKIETLRDIFLNSKIFEYIHKEGKYTKEKENSDDNDNYITKIIINYYLNRFFFKNKSNLNINNKIAEIVDVQIRIIGNIPVSKQKNIYKYNSIDYIRKYNRLSPSDKNVKLFLKEPSKITILALDNIDNIYNVFLDVSVFYKDKISDKIPLSLRIKTVGNCIQKANTLDKIMYDYLQDLYPKNLLENKLRNKESSYLQNKEEKPPENDIEIQKKIQKGGKKRDTKKIINKKRHNTLKNLVTYYAI